MCFEYVPHTLHTSCLSLMMYGGEDHGNTAFLLDVVLWADTSLEGG